MHWDMEGVSGIFTREHVWYWEEGTREHIAEEGRQLLIADVNSAAAAALEAGPHCAHSGRARWWPGRRRKLDWGEVGPALS